MKVEEIDAVLGIDTNDATSAELMRRVAEVCGEMSECYEDGTLEQTTFSALRYALCLSWHKWYQWPLKLRKE